MDERTAQILLHRHVSAVQPALRYQMQVDEKPVARLAISQRHTVDVTPGRHTIQATTLWMSSPAFAVDVAAGESVQLEVMPDVRHLWNMALHPKQFLRIAEVHRRMDKG